MPSLEFAFDHAVVYVRDLRRAVDDYTALGFHVVPGGVHSGGLTHNALIPLADGTYIELLAPARAFARAALRIAPLAGLVARRTPILRRAAGGEGFIGFALSCPSATAVAGIGAVGPVAGPISGGRIRPDGVRLAWKVAFPRAGVLPFVIEDTTPRGDRVPPAPAHPNGVTGAHTITVATAEFGESIERYQALLGREPFEATAPMPQVRAVEFRLPGTLIRLVAPAGASPVLRRHLERAGNSLYSIALRSNRPRAGALDLRLAHGAQMHLVPG